MHTHIYILPLSLSQTHTHTHTHTHDQRVNTRKTNSQCLQQFVMQSIYQLTAFLFCFTDHKLTHIAQLTLSLVSLPTLLNLSCHWYHHPHCSTYLVTSIISRWDETVITWVKAVVNQFRRFDQTFDQLFIWLFFHSAERKRIENDSKPMSASPCTKGIMTTV